MIGHQVTVLLNHNWGQKYENPRLRICKMRKNVCVYRNLQLKNNRQKKLNYQPYGWAFSLQNVQKQPPIVQITCKNRKQISKIVYFQGYRILKIHDFTFSQSGINPKKNL